MQRNLTVYRVPLGASMRKEFCQELKQMGYGKGVLLLPTGLLQNQVKTEYNIVASGFDTLANKILNLNGYDYLEEINYRSQQLVVKETLDYYAEQGQFQYLAALRDKTGFIKHMTALLSQLSRSGATSEEISNTLTSWGRTGNLGRKDREIALVYQGYRNMLKLQDRFDLEGKYRLALKILREQADVSLPWEKVYISDFATLDALQLELLMELAKHCLVKVGLCYEMEKAVSAVSQSTLDQLEKKGASQAAKGFVPERRASLEHLVATLGCQQVKKIAADDSLSLREYKHQLAEIKGVLAEIKQETLAGASLQDYAVAVYDLSSYNGLRFIADEYGIPLTLPKSEQLLVQPFTEFVLQLLAAVPDSRQGVEAYFALLSGSLGKLFFGTSLEGLEKLREDIFFKQRSAVQVAVAGRLEGQTLPKLLEQIDNFLGSCKLKNTVAGFVEDISGFVASIGLEKKLGELYKEGYISLAGLQNMLNSKRLLLDSLRSLKDDYAKCNMASEKYTLQEFSSLWQDGLKEVSLMLAGGRKDGLLVTNVVQLQGTSFKKVYIMGLREGEFPAGNKENWLYNDKERGELQSMGIDLPNTFNAYAADYCLFAGAVAAATERLVLSFYKDEEGEESPYVDEVQNLFIDLKVEYIEDKEITSRAEALEQSPNCEAQWLEQQVGLLTLEAAQLDKNRAGAYNGALKDKELLDKLQQGMRTKFSASSLNQYVDCPFKYLGTELWQQQDKGEKSEQLDGGTRGSLFHDTVAEFVGNYLNTKPMGGLEQLWPKLLAIYKNKNTEYQEQGKITVNEYWPTESEHLERMLSWWLRYELAEQAQWESFKPVALEKSFGSKEVLVNLETATQQKISLAGRVDRIDASDEAAFITDYKSGAAPSNGDFEKGADLQMAFYLLAAEQLCPGKEILGGNYLNLKKHVRQGGVAWKATGNNNIKVSGTKKAPSFTSWDEVRAAAETMVLQPVEELYKGNFAVNPKDKDACYYCPLKDICRYSVLQQQTVKEAKEEVNQDGQAEPNAPTAGDN